MVRLLYQTQQITSILEYPYSLIDIDIENEHFTFQFIEFDDGQSGYSIKMGGVTGQFGITYESKKLNCHFQCDITVGNVHDFYLSLKNAYDTLGDNSVAILKNYGNILKRTNLVIEFDNKGHCSVDGSFLNKENLYKSGVCFSFEIEQTYILDALNSMQIFFKELERIQCHNKFY